LLKGKASSSWYDSFFGISIHCCLFSALWAHPLHGQEVVKLDCNGHVGFGFKWSKEVATAIKGTIVLSKLPIVPKWRGYWGNKTGTLFHIPAPRDTGIVSAPMPKKLLLMTGIGDCCISARSCTATPGNFAKGIFDAISKTHSYLIPDL
ncbi:hypothetical protein A6R68_05637, partial [Neotoma lepida]